MTRWMIVAVALLAAAGCSDDASAPSYEATPITNLGVTGVSPVGVFLTWSAPSLEGGPAASYEARATTAAEGFDWDGATALNGEPAPSLPGAAQSCALTGLQPGTTYRLALRFGADGWWSSLSNIVTFTTIAAPPIPDGFVYVPAGAYTRGSPEDEPGRDADEVQHEVVLTRGVFLGRTEVTQAAWRAVMGGNPSHINCDDCPVTQISHLDAFTFCNRLSTQEGLQPCYTIGVDTVGWDRDADGYRLPTEAEWEYACRATTTTAFFSGDIDSLDCSFELNLDPVGNYCYGDDDALDEVAQKIGNAWDLYDTHGNVWELCWDWYDVYPPGPVIDPVGRSGGHQRVLRGGGWNSGSQQCRAASRSAVAPTWAAPSIGLRLARNAES